MQGQFLLRTGAKNDGIKKLCRPSVEAVQRGQWCHPCGKLARGADNSVRRQHLSSGFPGHELSRCGHQGNLNAKPVLEPPSKDSISRGAGEVTGTALLDDESRNKHNVGFKANEALRVS